jgi:aquaporin Z
MKYSYYLSEGIGTFFMMLGGISAITLNFGTEYMASVIPSPNWRLLLTGILFAGGGTLVTYSPVGKISGAHLNPAVTLAFLIKKKISLPDALIFMIVQTLGSIAAALLALYLWGYHAKEINIGMTLPGQGQTILTVFLVEVLITFLLIRCIFYFLHKKNLTSFTGLAVGILIAAIVYFTANITGSSMNPARSFGPALIEGDFSFLWIYLIAPLTGSTLAASVQLKKDTGHVPLCAKLNHQKEGCSYKGCKFGC